MMGMGEITRNLQKNEYENKGKKIPVWLPSHPPVDK